MRAYTKVEKTNLVENHLLLSHVCIQIQSCLLIQSLIKANDRDAARLSLAEKTNVARDLRFSVCTLWRAHM